MAKPTYKYKSISGVANAVYAEQTKAIEKKYGKEAAADAYYGWCVSGDESGVSIATKVYRNKGAMILTTSASIGDTIRDFNHSWEKD